jgi:hypothetical protein
MKGLLGLAALAIGGMALIVVLFLPAARPTAPEGGAMPCLPTLQTLAGKTIPTEDGGVPLDIGTQESEPPYVDAARANRVCKSAAMGRFGLGAAIGMGVAALVYVVGLATPSGRSRAS